MKNNNLILKLAVTLTAIATMSFGSAYAMEDTNETSPKTLMETKKEKESLQK